MLTTVTADTIVPEIVVELRLLQSSHGGRMSPIRQGEYRAIFGAEAQYFSCRLFVPMPDGMAPGETARFGVQFLVPEVALPFFAVGTRFTLWDHRTIGHGVVLEVPGR